MKLEAENQKKMNFSDYVEKLANPKRDFIEEVKAKTGKSTRTIYNWISGETEPSPAEMILIEEIYKKYSHE